MMGAQHDRKMLGVMKRAISQRWPITEEMKADLVQVAYDLAMHDPASKTRLKACQVAVAMEGQNLKDDVTAAREAESQAPGLTVNIQNASITVAPTAMASFLADCTPAPIPQVIEHQPEQPSS